MARFEEGLIQVVKKDLLRLAIEEQKKILKHQSGIPRVTRESINISSSGRSEDDDGYLHGLAMISTRNAHRTCEISKGLDKLITLKKGFNSSITKTKITNGSLIKTKLNGQELWLYVLPVSIRKELTSNELGAEVTVVTELSPVIQAIRNNPRKKYIRVNGCCEYEILEKF